MSITEQILQALSTPSLDDPSMGVWFNGKSEADSWIKITREINTDSGTLLPDGRWVPKPDPTAYTYIDILGKKQNQGQFKDMIKLKDRFIALKTSLPPGKYGINADHPTKAKYYQRIFKNDPWFSMSGEMAQGRKTLKTGEVVKERFETMVLEVPETPTEPPVHDFSDMSRTQATKKAKAMGLTEYLYNDRIIAPDGVGPKSQWRDNAKRNERYHRIVESTGQPGSQLESQLRREATRKASKGSYEPLTSEEVQQVADKQAKLKPGEDLDHIYDRAAYSKGKIEHPSNRAPLDRTINRGVKVQETKKLSQHMLGMELDNPSRSQTLEETLDLAADKPKYYEDVMHKYATNQRNNLLGKIGRGAKTLSGADSALQIASGNVIGGSIGLAMQTPAFQKAIAKTLAKSGAKLAPGVGIGLSALEAAGYASQGRWTQSGIATLSGLVGEVPLVGDAVSAGLDLANTGIDIATGNVGQPDIDEDQMLRKVGRTSRQLSLF